MERVLEYHHLARDEILELRAYLLNHGWEISERRKTIDIRSVQSESLGMIDKVDGKVTLNRCSDQRKVKDLENALDRYAERCCNSPSRSA